MTVSWKSVFVFVSSTFNDMHAERDFLVKHVFPQLRDWCAKRKLHLVDIDLRWGVTEQDATNSNVVKVCLDRINDCRPFFLCFLGQRRGWVPRSEDISPKTLENFPGLVDFIGNTSVTEMEILHALITPLHNTQLRDPNKGDEYYKKSKYAFFYLREDSYLDQLPADPPQLHQVYTNEGIIDKTTAERSTQELNRWRNEIIPATERPVRKYKAQWNPDLRTPELLLPLKCPSSEKKAINNWQEIWRKTGVAITGLDLEENPDAIAYNQRLSSGRLSNFICDNQPLSQMIIHVLQSAIIDRYPDHSEIAGDSDLQIELDQQEQFLYSGAENFIERGEDFAALDAYLLGDSRKLFVLTAEGGIGKSALLARWISRYQAQSHQQPGETIHFRFIGQSDFSTQVFSLLSMLIQELKLVAHKVQNEIPEDPQQLREDFYRFLEAAGKQGKTIIVLDGLNQLETGLSDLIWLPFNLPENLKLIVSFKRGEQDADDLLNHMQGQVIIEEVKPFSNPEDRRKLVEAYLDQFLKQLDDPLLDALISLPAAANPLYLKVVLSELRVFGAFTNLGEKIHSDFGNTPISAFDAVLNRLENDPAYSEIDPKQAVPLLFGLLAHARYGLSIEELSEIFVQTRQANKNTATETIHLFLRQVRPFLAIKGNRYDFFFESFKLAALKRYEKDHTESPGQKSHQEWHRLLADYFARLSTWIDLTKDFASFPPADKLKIANRRKVEELPYHYTGGENWIRLAQILRDLQFIEAKITAGMLDDLLADYRRAQTATNNILVSSLSEISAFLLSQSHILRRFPFLTYQQAANQPENSTVAHIAQENPSSKGWLKWINKPVQRASCLLEFSSPRKETTLAAVDQVHNRVVLIQKTTATLYDLGNGSQQFSFPVEPIITRCCFSDDGNRLILGSSNGSIIHMDPWNGRILSRHVMHRSRVTGIAVSPMAECSIDLDGQVVVRDLQDNSISTFSTSLKNTTSCALHPYKPCILIGEGTARLEYWNYITQECLASMENTQGLVEYDQFALSRNYAPIADCKFSKDGKQAVVAQDGKLSGAVHVFDLNQDQVTCSYSFYGATHKLDFFNRVVYLEGGFSACSIISSDHGFQAVDRMHNLAVFIPGRQAYRTRFVPGIVRDDCILCEQLQDSDGLLTVDSQGICRIWDLSLLGTESLSEPQQLIPVLAGSVSPIDNRIAVCCDDGAVRIWDQVKQRYHDPFGGDTWFDHARTCVSWCKDGQQLLTGGEEDFCFDLWSFDGTLLKRFETSSAFPLLCEMAPDDSVGAFATRNGTVAIRSLNQTVNECEYSRTNHVIESIKFINQSELIVSWEDGIVTLWNWLLDKVLWELQLHQGPAICMCDSEGKRIASAGKDGFLRIFQTSNSQLLASMDFAESIHLLSWSSSDRFIAVCTTDLLIIDVETWEIRFRWCLSKPLVFLDFTPEANTIAGGTSDGQILLLQIQSQPEFYF